MECTAQSSTKVCHTSVTFHRPLLLCIKTYTTDVYILLCHQFWKCFFFSRYFFYVLTALIVLGVFNGLVFLPVLLVMIGPPPEVVPRRNNGSGSSNRIDPPSPEPSPAPVRSASFHHHQPNTVSSIDQPFCSNALI